MQLDATNKREPEAAGTAGRASATQQQQQQQGHATATSGVDGSQTSTSGSSGSSTTTPTSTVHEHAPAAAANTSQRTPHAKGAGGEAAGGDHCFAALLRCVFHHRQSIFFCFCLLFLFFV